jgi:hypothetical protein
MSSIWWPHLKRYFLCEWYTAFMNDWEGGLNHYLITGGMIAY